MFLNKCEKHSRYYRQQPTLSTEENNDVTFDKQQLVLCTLSRDFVD